MTINVNGSRCYWTDFSTASKRLNPNNPILSDQRERSVGGMKHPLDQRLEETPHNNKKEPSNSQSSPKTLAISNFIRIFAL